MGIKQYYKYYLTLHQNKYCRLLHFIGQITTIFYILFILYNNYWLLLLAAPFIVYPFAWLGHFLFEKNKPAAFSSPIKAKISDWLMFRDIVLGKLVIW